MDVVSDNGPVGFLVEIGFAEVLRNLFDQVFVPPAVVAEWRHPRTPEPVRLWTSALPDWVTIASPKHREIVGIPGAGEREAISLAKEMGVRFLCDDRQAVAFARREGLAVTGTLGVLREAHGRGLIQIEQTFDRLRETTDFRFPDPAVVQAVIRDAHEMRAWILRR